MKNKFDLKKKVEKFNHQNQNDQDHVQDVGQNQDQDPNPDEGIDDEEVTGLVLNQNRLGQIEKLNRDEIDQHQIRRQIHLHLSHLQDQVDQNRVKEINQANINQVKNQRDKYNCINMYSVYSFL